jgi:hypothetical protein
MRLQAARSQGGGRSTAGHGCRERFHASRKHPSMAVGTRTWRAKCGHGGFDAACFGDVTHTLSSGILHARRYICAVYAWGVETPCARACGGALRRNIYKGQPIGIENQERSSGIESPSRGSIRSGKEGKRVVGMRSAAVACPWNHGHRRQPRGLLTRKLHSIFQTSDSESERKRSWTDSRPCSVSRIVRTRP